MRVVVASASLRVWRSWSEGMPAITMISSRVNGREPLDQLRQNGRKQIKAALQKLPGAGGQFRLSSHRQGEQIQEWIKVLLVAEFLEAEGVDMAQK